MRLVNTLILKLNGSQTVLHVSKKKKIRID